MAMRAGHLNKNGNWVASHPVKTRKKFPKPVGSAAKTADLKAKLQNQERKAEDMVDALILLLTIEERKTHTDLTSPDKLRELADNLANVVDERGEQLMLETGRLDPPSAATQSLMVRSLYVRAGLAEPGWDDLLDDL